MYPPYQDPSLPQAQPMDEDLVNFQSPVEDMPAEMPVPEKPSKGMSFDFSVIDVQTQEEYEALPPVLKQLRHEIVAYGKLPSPEQAAAMVDRIKTEFDAVNSPKAQAQTQAAKLSAQKTKLDIEKLEKEKIAAAKDSAEVATRKQLIFDKIDKYTNPENPKYTPLNALVGKWDGTAGALLDASGVNDKRAAQRAELDRLVSSDILELTKFLKPIAGTDLEFLRSMVPKIHQNDTIWTDYLTDSKKVLEVMTAAPAASQQAPAPQAAPQAAPAQPQQPATRVIGGRTFIQQPNGNWIPR